MSDPVRFGFLGASQILKNAHGRGFREAHNAHVVGIASRHRDKAEQFAAELGIDHVFDTYDALLASPDVEAVLITLPMKLHAPWIVRALEHGKHVLCEKPMVLSVTEAETVRDAAKRSGRLVLEAFSHVYAEQQEYVRGLLRDGQIGETRVVRAEVLYPTLDWEHDSRAYPSLGGRVLIEAGCYCVKAIRDVMRDEPTDVHGFAAHRLGGDLQTTFVGVLKFPGQRLGYLCTTMESSVRICVDIIGTGGRIEMPDLFKGPVVRVLRTGEEPQEKHFEARDRFQLQAEHFADCIRHGTSPIITLEDSVENIRVLEALNASAY